MGVFLLQMAGETAETPELGAQVEEEEQQEQGDQADAKPDRRGRFLLFGQWVPWMVFELPDPGLETPPPCAPLNVPSVFMLMFCS